MVLFLLFKYGFNDISMSWFRSFLINRYQFIKFKNTLSTIKPVNVGIARESILRPQLFSIWYKNGMLFLFANDMTIIISGKDYEEIEHKANSDLNLINKWLKKNKMIINAQKSSFMIIGCPKQTDICIFCG